MIENWKRIYQENRERLKPNRKSGIEIDEYFRGKYKPEPFHSEKFKEIVRENIMLNERLRNKLPKGKLPDIICYLVENQAVMVGIDLVTGHIHVECDDIPKMEEVYDDLFVFKGLDEEDLRNFILVAQYIQCSEQ